LSETWHETSPLATIIESALAPVALSEGPVRFLLVSGERDDGSWGIVGAYWLTIDGRRGGFLVSHEAIWQGSEHARGFRNALTRGWNTEQIYSYWQSHVGAAGSVMVDPQHHADALFQVARRVGCL
jgi:hypothetical protein